MRSLKFAAALALATGSLGAQAQPPADESSAAAAAPERFALHGQATFVVQSNPSFHAPFEGPNSLHSRGETRETADLTFYLGASPWRGAELWADPEIDQGFGLANTTGAAGFPSGEAYKVGKANPYFRLQRLFFRQTIGARRRHGAGRARSQPARRDKAAGPAGRHHRQILGRRHFRRERPRPRSARRLPQLDAHRRGRVRLCRRFLGLYDRRRRRALPGTPGAPRGSLQPLANSERRDARNRLPPISGGRGDRGGSQPRRP